jgi:hypothetical protein
VTICDYVLWRLKSSYPTGITHRDKIALWDNIYTDKYYLLQITYYPPYTKFHKKARDEIKPVSNHSNKQTVWMVWKFDLDKLLKEQFFNLLQLNILIKTIWSSLIFIWCAHKLKIRDFFVKIFNTFNFFQFFKILILNWFDLIPNSNPYLLLFLKISKNNCLQVTSFPIWASHYNIWNKSVKIKFN